MEHKRITNYDIVQWSFKECLLPSAYGKTVAEL